MYEDLVWNGTAKGMQGSTDTTDLFHIKMLNLGDILEFDSYSKEKIFPNEFW